MTDWGKNPVWQTGEYEGITELDAAGARSALQELIEEWRAESRSLRLSSCEPADHFNADVIDRCADELRELIQRWPE